MTPDRFLAGMQKLGAVFSRELDEAILEAYSAAPR
jgi:hypothetical protein